MWTLTNGHRIYQTVCELISVYYISNYQVGVTVDVNIMSWLGVEKVSRIQVSLNSTGPI